MLKQNNRKRILIIFAGFVSLLLLTTITHQTLNRYEHQRYQALGTMVEVNGEKMHVYTQGSGDKNIVLLAGYGTAGPVLDFMPLVELLADTYTVTVVENFGYGWSDHTNRARTIENIVEETREALQKAGIQPPYILAPHSISGLYAIYYSIEYPDEVEAVIGLDIALPEHYAYGQTEKKSYFETTLMLMGLYRVVSLFNPSLKMPNADEGLYSEEALKQIRMMYCWNFYNKTLVNEWNMSDENAAKLSGKTFPVSMPFMLIAAESDALRENFVSTSENWTLTVIPGANHYLHYNKSVQVAEEIDSFISSIR
jgi:pimeloyl-ACP methyl ester carboxylesterase